MNQPSHKPEAGDSTSADSASLASDQTPVQDRREAELSQQLSLRHDRVPTSVAGYEVQKCLGEGSFGMVWLATERKTGRQVAIKFFTNRRGLDWTLLTREVEKLAVLDASRDVVRLLDVGWDHDPPYFVMEYLPHQSVAALLENGPLPVEQAVGITRAIARALVHAHSAGILHCDIKPANVLLDHGDGARLGDFGQSRLSSDQSPALGTFYYMAPEQARLDAVPDVRWDVYALGAVLYHMLTGAPPYQNEATERELAETTSLADRLQVYRRIIDRSPPPVDHRQVQGVDSRLADIIDRCLKLNTSERIPSAQGILDLFEKREMDRARRPLILLGVLGPVLLLLVMLWISSSAVPAAVNQAETNLFQRALTSDAATVRLLAASVEQELLERQDELERLARRLSPREDGNSFQGFREDYVNVIDEWRQETNERFTIQRRTIDESIFLTDEFGTQIYRDPWNDSIGRSFAYRDYFHNLGRELPREVRVGGEIQPRTTPGVSLAFRSSNTKQFMVAIAVPVWSRDQKEVLGILARTIHLTDLLSQWENRIESGEEQAVVRPEDDRFLSLVDTREESAYLLDHHWMSGENLSGQADDEELKSLLMLTPQETKILEESVEDDGVIPNYQDPLADIDPAYQGEWLAAVAKIGTAGWIAIVQERRADAIEQMNELRMIFIRYGLLMLIIFAVMLTGLWWLIQKTARQ